MTFGLDTLRSKRSDYNSSCLHIFARSTLKEKWFPSSQALGRRNILLLASGWVVMVFEAVEEQRCQQDSVTCVLWSSPVPLFSDPTALLHIVSVGQNVNSPPIPPDFPEQGFPFSTQRKPMCGGPLNAQKLATSPAPPHPESKRIEPNRNASCLSICLSVCLFVGSPPPVEWT